MTLRHKIRYDGKREYTMENIKIIENILKLQINEKLNIGPEEDTSPRYVCEYMPSCQTLSFQAPFVRQENTSAGTMYYQS